VRALPHTPAPPAPPTTTSPVSPAPASLPAPLAASSSPAPPPYSTPTSYLEIHDHFQTQIVYFYLSNGLLADDKEAV
jgi:hypothetical protein